MGRSYNQKLKVTEESRYQNSKRTLLGDPWRGAFSQGLSQQQHNNNKRKNPASLRLSKKILEAKAYTLCR
jgi:hypothetical protein